MRFISILFIFVAGACLSALAGSPNAMAQQDEGAMSYAQVSQLVDNLGYKTEKPDAETTTIKFDEDDWTMDIDVSLSKSGRKLWLMAYLVKEPFPFTGDDYKAMLQSNSDIGPAHFTIDGKWVLMDLALDNRGLNPTIMRREIKFLVDNVKDTEKVWSKKK